MEILRQAIMLLLLTGASTACVTVSVGDEPKPIATDVPVNIADRPGSQGNKGATEGIAGDETAAPPGGEEVPLPIADNGPVEIDGGGLPGDDLPAPDGAGTVVDVPGEVPDGGSLGGEVIMLGGGESNYSVPGSVGDGSIIVIVPDEPTGAGLPTPDGGETGVPPAEENGHGTEAADGADEGGKQLQTIGGIGGLSGQVSGAVIGGTTGLSTTTTTGSGYGGGSSHFPAGSTAVDVQPKAPEGQETAAPSPPVETESETAAGWPKDESPPRPPDTPSPAPPEVVPAEPVGGESGAAAPSGSTAEGIDAYLAGLKEAAYTFNPPSPIKVARPRTIHLWLDPQATPEALAEALRAAVPEDTERIEAGETSWSPVMEATLTGSAFDIKPITPARQSVATSRRTEWTWEVTATRVGAELPLYLTLDVILPEELGPPHNVATLARRIDVEVTLWWAFDHYFDRYWKWLLGSLGTACTGAIAWWWKRRANATASA